MNTWTIAGAAIGAGLIIGAFLLPEPAHADAVCVAAPMPTEAAPAGMDDFRGSDARRLLNALSAARIVPEQVAARSSRVVVASIDQEAVGLFIVVGGVTCAEVIERGTYGRIRVAVIGAGA